MAKEALFLKFVILGKNRRRFAHKMNCLFNKPLLEVDICAGLVSYSPSFVYHLKVTLSARGALIRAHTQIAPGENLSDMPNGWRVSRSTPRQVTKSFSFSIVAYVSASFFKRCISCSAEARSGLSPFLDAA